MRIDRKSGAKATLTAYDKMLMLKFEIFKFSTRTCLTTFSFMKTRIFAKSAFINFRALVVLVICP